MIDLAISLLVGAGVVCGTHHSHSDRDGLALPTPLTPLGKAHHFPLSTHSSAGPLRAILLALLAGGVARFGLALLARARAAAQPEGLHGGSVLALVIAALALAQVLVAPVLARVLLAAERALKGPLLRGCLAVPLLPRCSLGAAALRLSLGLADLREVGVDSWIS